MTGRWTLLGLCLIGGTALVCTTPKATAAPASLCLQRAAGDIYVPNVTSGVTNKINIAANKTADFRPKPLVEDPPQYGLIVRDMDANACITGLKMTGLASTSLTWNVRKGDYDGDGVRIQLDGSPVIVERVHFKNVMDGVSPRGNNSNYRWHVRAAYMVGIRDDAIENDGCLGGTIEDSLIETFMGFSSRPGKVTINGVRVVQDCPPGYQDNTFNVKNVFMRLECQPYSGGSTGCGSTKAVGQIFKWRGSSPIPVDVRDSIFVQPALSHGGTKAMCYRPPGRYSNVTIIWQGSGSWPCKEPPGVTVTRDINIWNQAKAAWLQRYDCAANGSSCPFTSR